MLGHPIGFVLAEFSQNEVRELVLAGARLHGAHNGWPLLNDDLAAFLVTRTLASDSFFLDSLSHLTISSYGGQSISPSNSSRIRRNTRDFA